MSSAILYLAIVAIWAVILVPRWLRPPHAKRLAGSQPGEDPGQQTGEDPGQHAEPAWQEEDGSTAAPPAPAPATSRAGEVRAGRARILRVRRGMLITLIVLTAGAAVLAMTHLAAGWVTIPPVVLLAGFVLLLREAARTDASRASATAARRGHQGQDGQVTGDVRAQTGPDGAEPGEPAAQVIDIAARVADQLYDQYADAAVRAVGD